MSLGACLNLGGVAPPCCFLRQRWLRAMSLSASRIVRSSRTEGRKTRASAAVFGSLLRLRLPSAVIPHLIWRVYRGGGRLPERGKTGICTVDAFLLGAAGRISKMTDEWRLSGYDGPLWKRKWRREDPAPSAILSDRGGLGVDAKLTTIPMRAARRGAPVSGAERDKRGGGNQEAEDGGGAAGLLGGLLSRLRQPDVPGQRQRRPACGLRPR